MNSGTLSLETVTNKTNRIFKRKQLLLNETSKEKQFTVIWNKFNRKKIRNSSNAKEYYQSYLKKEKTQNR